MSVRPRRRQLLAGLVTAGLVAGCASEPAEPTADGATLDAAASAAATAGRSPADDGPAAPGAAEPSAAEVAFVQGMIPHHAQALRMTSLVEDRVEDPAVATLAGLIEVAQRDELRTLQRWLEERDQSVPSLLAAHEHDPGAEGTPGMLTEERLLELDAASGRRFDRLFLEGMIEHHRGAIDMVEQLHAAGEFEDLSLARLAHVIETDQRVEIQRMRRVLDRLDD